MFNFCTNNTSLPQNINPSKEILSGSDILDISRNILNTKLHKKIYIRPYVELGLRIPYWLTKGLLELVSPFKRIECVNLETFNYSAEKLSDALYLKPIDTINEYRFCDNYGLCVQLNGVLNNKEYDNADRLKNLYNGINSIIGKDKNDSANSYTVFFKFLVDFLDDNKYNVNLEGSEKLAFFKNIKALKSNIKSLVKDFFSDSDISLVNKSDLSLSPLAFINIARFLFIKNAADTFVNNCTEKRLSEYFAEYGGSLDSLCNKLSKLLPEYHPIKIGVLKDIAADARFFKNKEQQNLFISYFDDINRILTNSNLLKGLDDANLSDKTLNDIKYILESNGNTKNLLDFCDDFFYIRQILFNSKEVFENILGENPKNLIDNLTNKKLLPALTSSVGKDRFIEIKKNLLTLYHKLLKVKQIREHKKILKSLKKENTVWLHPFNYRSGVNFNYYFNKFIGINIDISISYSRLGLIKSIFLPNDFLQSYFYYLYKLHSQSLYGNIYSNKDLNVDDVFFSNFCLPIKDLVCEGIIKNIAMGIPLVGDTNLVNTYAFDNYLNVINYYSDVDYSLCDIKVKLEQINFCLKTGAVININGIINRNKNVSSNIMNEFIINFGLYFNFQRIRINATLNPNNKNSEEVDVYKKYFTSDIFSDALVDVLINLGIFNSDSKYYNGEFVKMLLFIKNDLYGNEVIPKSNNVLRYINNIFDDDLAENCMITTFNVFKVRYLFEIVYRLTLWDYSIIFGCEFIFNSPLDIKKNNDDYINQLHRNNSNISVKNVELPINIEILPHIGFSRCFSF